MLPVHSGPSASKRSPVTCPQCWSKPQTDPYLSVCLACFAAVCAVSKGHKREAQLESTLRELMSDFEVMRRGSGASLGSVSMSDANTLFVAF